MPDVSMYRDDIARLVEAPRPYPQGRFAGAGIVICAGGRSYFTCAWVLVNLLRTLGCQLPIEVWYRSRKEMNGRKERLLETVEGVRCVDASEHGPDCRLRGWEIKPFSIIHCPFEDVLFIDCDNVPTRDPSFLLNAQQYRRCGSIFWPDRWMGRGDRDDVRTMADGAWEACGLEPRDEPELESGQMVINKRKCWRALQLTMFLNVHSEFFYELVLGDKDTFHLACDARGWITRCPCTAPTGTQMTLPSSTNTTSRGTACSSTGTRTSGTMGAPTCTSLASGTRRGVFDSSMSFDADGTALCAGIQKTTPSPSAECTA